MQNIWNKDRSRLQFSVVEIVGDISKESLLSAEQKHIDAAASNPSVDMMNVLMVAGSHLGAKRSDETKERLSAAMTGQKHSDSSKEKMRAAKIGRKQSDEHRMKCSIARTGKTINRKKGGANKGVRKFSDSQIIEMRKMKESGSSYSEIESIHGVSHGGLQKIVKRETYRDVANG
jgi:hypothetical protein